MEFYRYIWNYRKNQFPKILGYVDAYFKGRLIRIHSEASKREFVRSIQSGTTTASEASSAGT
jgi:hypothetical protein